MAKKTIYMNEPLQRLADKTKGETARSGRFSARLGEIVERYGIIMELSAAPNLTDTELAIMSEVLCGSVLDRRKIRGLHLDVLDAATGTDAERKALSAKLKTCGPAERMKLIENLLNQNSI